MVLNFLTRSIKLREQSGQAHLQNFFLAGIEATARLFEEADEPMRTRIRSISREFQTHVDDPSGRGTILFLEPRSPIHVQAALGEFQGIQIDAGSISTPYHDGELLRLPNAYWQWLIYRGMTTEGAESNFWIQMLLDDIGELLWNLKPRLIVYRADSRPLERAFSVMAKAMGIPVATIQHGLFPSTADPQLLEGDASDYFLTWGNFSSEMLSRSGYLPRDRFHVIGYPYPTPKLPLPAVPLDHRKTVVFLGQPFELYKDSWRDAKVRSIQFTQEACKDLGLEFRYRMHPSETQETLADLVPLEALLPQSQPLAEVFIRYETFVSCTSSALIEAGLHGRTAIQIYDPALEFDNYGEHGASYACTNSQPGIRQILEQVATGQLRPHPVNPNYLPLSPDLPGRILEVYKAVMTDWENREPVTSKLTSIHIEIGPSKSSVGIESMASKPESLNNVSTSRSIEGLTIYSRKIERPRVPANLSVEEAHRFLIAVTSSHLSEYQTSSIVAIFSKFFLEEMDRSVSVHLTLTNPFTDDRDSFWQVVDWLNLTRVALDSRGSKTTTLSVEIDQSFERTPATNDLPALIAQAIFIALSGSDRLVSPVSDSLFVLLRSSEASISEFIYQRHSHKAQAERMMATLKEAQSDLEKLTLNYRQLEQHNDSLTSIVEEFDRVKATRFWRIRQSLARFMGSN
jgi:hypothetical protein